MHVHADGVALTQSPAYSLQNETRFRELYIYCQLEACKLADDPNPECRKKTPNGKLKVLLFGSSVQCSLLQCC